MLNGNKNHYTPVPAMFNSRHQQSSECWCDQLPDGYLWNPRPHQSSITWDVTKCFHIVTAQEGSTTRAIIPADFIMAAVSTPLLGSDFLCTFRLQVNSNSHLIDILCLFLPTAAMFLSFYWGLMIFLPIHFTIIVYSVLKSSHDFIKIAIFSLSNKTSARPHWLFTRIKPFVIIIHSF